VTLAPVTLTAGESLNITACGLCGDKAVWLVYEMRKPIAGAGYTYHVQGTARSIVGAGATNDYPYRGGPWNACDGFLSIIVGEGITSIGDGAFYHTEMSYSYTDVSLPGTLRSIGDDAFNGLAFGNAMTLPEGLVSLGNNAFSNSNITALHLPASLREIGFWDGADELRYNPIGTQCRYLQEITASENSSVLCARDGVLYTKDMTA